MSSVLPLRLDVGTAAGEDDCLGRRLQTERQVIEVFPLTAHLTCEYNVNVLENLFPDAFLHEKVYKILHEVLNIFY